MSCATSTLKFTAFGLNLLCCIFGALVFSAGVITLISFDTGDLVRINAIIAVALGAVLFLVNIIGCVSILKESVRWTTVCAFIMILLACGQVAIVVIEPTNFNEAADQIMDTVWQNQFAEEYSMEHYEMKYACCGKKGPQDYISSGMTVPKTCYLNQDLSTDILFSQGCAEALRMIFENSEQLERISDWSLLGLEILTVITTSLLAISFKNSERRKLFH